MRKLVMMAALGAAACGGGGGERAGSEADWIDDVLAETDAAPTQEWIEVPLAENVFAGPAAAYRTDMIEIEVPAFGAGLEYKLAMREGDVITYAWDAGDLATPELFLSEFHGHTERVGDAPGTVMFYRRAVGRAGSGALTAPFDGVHGWYFRNDTEEPVVVRLQVAGFYELVDE